MSLLSIILRYVTVNEIIKGLSDTPLIYIRPIKYFDSFFQKDIKNKLIQVISSVTLVLFLSSILLHKIRWETLLKVYLFEMFSMFRVIISIYVANRISGLLGGIKVSVVNIVFFSVLTKTLYSSLQILFFKLFNAFENYHYLFFQNLIILIVTIVFYISSAFIFQKKTKLIALTIFLNILTVNLIIGISHKLSLDNYSSVKNPYKEDQLLVERDELFEKKHFSNFRYPTHRIVIKVHDSVYDHFIFGNLTDSISTGSFNESDKYFNSLSKKILHIDSILPLINFKRNKDFANELKSIYLSIDSLMRTNLNFDDINPLDIVKVTDFLSFDGTLYKQFHVLVNSNIYSRTNGLLNEHTELNDKSFYAFLPLYLSYNFYPIIIIF